MKDSRCSERNSSEEDAITIRALRAQSNEAIARHETEPPLAILHDNVKIIASNGSLIDGAGAMGRAFEKSFADPEFITYTRNPLAIDVNDATAAESGNWIGRWKQRVDRGIYLARWNRDTTGWRIVSELFIPLARDSDG